MSDPIPIPEELHHLIEKRSGEENRKQDRRQTTTESSPPCTDQKENPSDQDRDCRSNDDRRQSVRRKADKH